MNIKKIIYTLLIFHPKGPFKKVGPYLFIGLLVMATPLFLHPESRQSITEMFGDVKKSAQRPGTQTNSPTSSLPNTSQSQNTSTFDPLAQQGVWAVTEQDKDRATWSWSKAKSFSADIWENQTSQPGLYSSFYCGCDITRTGASSGEVDLNSCGYGTPKNENRATRLEWEHIVPAATLGSARQCWTTGLPQCKDSSGQAIKGRECCEMADPIYQMMSNDPVNLKPSIGEVNGDRSNYDFGFLGNAGKSYGQCQMRVDSSTRTVEPPNDRKGDIGRVYAYMSKAYGLSFPENQKNMFVQWMAQDPVSQEEITINTAIKNAGHRGNPFVSSGGN
jgi:deoxyribonuclease-1